MKNKPLIDDKFNLQKHIVENFEDVDLSLNSIMGLEDNESVMLMSAFSGLSSGLNLYYAKDGKKLIPVNGSTVIYTPSLGTLRDPSMMYKNGTFYLAFTGTQPSGVGFTIAKSTDLLTWTEQYIAVPSQYTKCWAPEWFEDNGNVYAVISLQNNNAVENDTTGTSIPYFKQFYMKCTNLSTLAFDAPLEMTFSQISNKIDSFIYKENEIYNCFVKNEFAKTIEHYTNSSFESGTWTFQRTVAFPVYAEGASITKYNGKYYLYADGFSTNTTWCRESADLVNWGTAYLVNNLSNVRTQHFSVLLTNAEINKKIGQMRAKCSPVIINDTRADYIADKKYFSLSSFMSGSTLKMLNYPDAVYKVVYGENITIDNIDTTEYNYEGSRTIMLIVQSNANASITIKNANNILTPSNIDFVISPTNANNETIIKLVCSGTNDKKFRLENDQNTGRYILNNKQQIKVDLYQPTKVDLTTLATAGVITSLAVNDDTYYYVSGTGAVTVNAIDNANVTNKTANIYFCVESSDVNAKIILKTGGAIITPGAVDMNIGKAYSNNDIVFNFKKLFTWSSGWRKLG